MHTNLNIGEYFIYMTVEIGQQYHFIITSIKVRTA